MSLRYLRLLAAGLCLAIASESGAQEFQSRFAETRDGVWTGPEYWANPLQDWRVSGGRAECLSEGSSRSLHLLTYQLTDRSTAEIRVTIDKLRAAFRGTVGMEFGIQGRLDDHRYHAIWGKGLAAGLRAGGSLVLAGQTADLTEEVPTPLTLVLKLEPDGGGRHHATLEAVGPSGEPLGQLTTAIDSARISGNVALVSDGAKRRAMPGDPVAAFRDWRLQGSGLRGGPGQNWGPILWAQYTLDEGVLKLQAQLAPTEGQGDDVAELQIERAGWQTVARAKVDPLSRTAQFRAPDWDRSRDVPYRVVYRWCGNEYRFPGTVRHDPVEKDVITIAGFTGNKDYGFPNPTIVANVARLDPDVLFFSGDQLYESNAGFGITRSPLEVAALDYLRKWYLVGWSFGELMRDRPTIHLPDDHDVYQGNLWGAGGRPTENLNQGGYLMDPVWVNMVQRTQTGHLPDPVDPRPVAQGITVYFTEMTYGRVGMAILEDRKFKVGPPMVPGEVSLEEATLLGQRQLDFLERWAGDWRGQDAKVTLSQTVFAQCHTYGGRQQKTRAEDRDANGWPPAGRNRAVRAIRKAHALMYAGDNHLPTVVHHGVDTWEDAGVSFTVPSIAAGFPREWRPDRVGVPRRGGLPPGAAEPTYPDGVPGYIGRFTSSWKHPLTFYAVANPNIFTGAGGGADAGDLELLDQKRSGFGLVRFHKPSGRITIECYRILAELDRPETAQMPGWPVVLSVRDNYARQPAGFLPEVHLGGIERPVLRVTDQATGEMVYAIRLTSPSVRPWVFADGTYQVELGDPDTGRWKTWTDVKP